MHGWGLQNLPWSSRLPELSCVTSRCVGNESLKEQTNPEEGASRKLTGCKLRG